MFKFLRIYFFINSNCFAIGDIKLIYFLKIIFWGGLSMREKNKRIVRWIALITVLFFVASWVVMLGLTAMDSYK